MLVVCRLRLILTLLQSQHIVVHGPQSRHGLTRVSLCQAPFAIPSGSKIRSVFSAVSLKP